MKAITIRLDEGGPDAILKRVRAGQELGFDRFDLCVSNPQAALGRVASQLKEAGVRLCALRLNEPRHDATVARRPGYSKLGALDPQISTRSAEMIIETANIFAPLKPEFVVLDGGHMAVNDLQSRLLKLSDALDSCDDTETREGLITDSLLDATANTEAQLDHACRALHRITKTLAPLQVCLLTPGNPLGLMQSQNLQLVLDDLPHSALGYWHCTSRAAILQKLGGTKAHDWITNFGSSLKGVYLADMLGGHGDQTPGLGEIDFQALAPELASNTVRVMVVDDNKGTKLRFGTDYLAKVGIF
ncbi:hypothetical protein OAU50_05260 [Planctomycetota bacterium]|nr:hypothetical protein [Planctomycetota bacterium]